MGSVIIYVFVAWALVWIAHLIVSFRNERRLDRMAAADKARRHLEYSSAKTLTFPEVTQ